MPKFLEEKLKKEYPDNPGAVYGTLNKTGAMHGSKETKKGKNMEKKHKIAGRMTAEHFMNRAKQLKDALK